MIFSFSLTGFTLSYDLRTFSYIIISRLILHCSLDTIGQETEDGTSPQKHGETTKHLKEKHNNLVSNLQKPWKVSISDAIYNKADVTCLQNLTHSGVVGGGVRALGPSRARTSAAFALVKPWCEERKQIHLQGLIISNCKHIIIVCQPRTHVHTTHWHISKSRGDVGATSCLATQHQQKKNRAISFISR